ncbi:MAG: hypothetical protein ACRC46_06615, partial [Thermoguttaceae bacterium]
FAMSREAVAGIAPPALGCKPAPTRAGLPATPSPPITNRGVTLYTDTVPASEPDGTNPDVSPTPQRIMGGYDGGVVVGFDGRWRAFFLFTSCHIFDTLLASLALHSS